MLQRSLMLQTLLSQSQGSINYSNANLTAQCDTTDNNQTRNKLYRHIKVCTVNLNVSKVKAS